MTKLTRSQFPPGWQMVSSPFTMTQGENKILMIQQNKTLYTGELVTQKLVHEIENLPTSLTTTLYKNTQHK